MAVLHRHRPKLLGDSLTETGSGSRYDKSYFDKWYRNPRHRVKSPAELSRQVTFVLSAAEWVLGRAVRTVLDVGAGEGNWYPVLRKLRPSIRYEGIDPSEYAVARFGAKRNIALGGIEDVETIAQRDSYDLVVCCGMLNYLSASQLTNGVRQVAKRTGGLAYLELFAAEDSFEGDTSWPTPKRARWYRQLMRRSGLLAVGMQCYVPRANSPMVASLERI